MSLHRALSKRLGRALQGEPVDSDSPGPSSSLPWPGCMPQVFHDADFLELAYGCHRVWAEDGHGSRSNQPSSFGLSSPLVIPSAGRKLARPETDCVELPHPTQFPAYCPTSLGTSEAIHSRPAPPRPLQLAVSAHSDPRLAAPSIGDRQLEDQSAVPLCRANFQPVCYDSDPNRNDLAITQRAAAPVVTTPPSTTSRIVDRDLDDATPVSSLIHNGPLEQLSAPFSPSSLWDITNAKYPNEATRPEPNASGCRSPGLARASADGLIPLAAQQSVASTACETVAPFVSGEIQIFERQVYYTRNFQAFDERRRQRSLLKIFRSNWNKALRFQLTTVGGVKEHSFEIHPNAYELVVAHAYTTDPAWENVLYIHRRPSDGSTERLPPSQRNIVFMCRLDDTADVADFQRALLGEAIVLDISSVRSIRCLRRRETLEISNCRVQIWHEDRASPLMQSDATSFTINTIKLSGRPQENSRPRYTRIVIFLGRREEYMTFLITDDVQLVKPAASSNAYDLSLRLQPRGHGGSRWRVKGSAPALKLRQTRRNSHAAGFLLGGPSVDPEDDESFRECQGLEIEFEDSKEYGDFVDIWEQAIHFRREKKAVLQTIEERMGREQFNGRQARRLLF